MNNPQSQFRIATVGTFDGVHRGHELVLKCLREEALRENLTPLVITFDRHPLSVIAPEREPGLLVSADEKTGLLEDSGVAVHTVPFTEQIRRLTAYEWMRRLHDRLGVRTLIVGYDNTFGTDGLSMNLNDYQALGEVIGIRVMEAPVLENVSSSAIRKAIKAGDIRIADEMLGRPYRLEGIVQPGNHLGSRIGFPTANIRPPQGRVIPAEGVYAAVATLPDGTSRPAAVNIGKRPTIGDLTSPLIEANILDFEGDLYGKRIILDFIDRIRGEEKFVSIEQLREQLSRDVKKVREFYCTNKL